MAKTKDGTLTTTIGLHRVLIATDLSLDGGRAVRRASRLPLRSGAHLLLVYVLPEGVQRSAESVILGAAELELEAAQQKLEAWLRHRDRQDVTVAIKVMKGNPAEAIARLAEVIDAELICIGRRGLSRLQRALMGSTARRLVRLARRPVLVVSRPATAGYRHAVVGHDLTPVAARAARFARQLVPLTGRLTAVHGYQDPMQNVPPGLILNEPRVRRFETAKILGDRRGRMELALEPLVVTGKEWHQVIEQADPRTLLLGVAHKRNADLIAVGSAARTGVNRLLLGSVAEAVLERAPCDVLVVRTGA